MKGRGEKWGKLWPCRAFVIYVEKREETMDLL